MKIEVDIKKKYFFTLLSLFIVLSVVAVGVAFGTNNPAEFGHTLGEVQLPACTEGQVLKVVGGVWTCGSSGAVTSVSGTGDIVVSGTGDRIVKLNAQSCGSGNVIEGVDSSGNFICSSAPQSPGWFAVDGKAYSCAGFCPTKGLTSVADSQGYICRGVSGGYGTSEVWGPSSIGSMLCLGTGSVLDGLVQCYCG